MVPTSSSLTLFSSSRNGLFFLLYIWRKKKKKYLIQNYTIFDYSINAPNTSVLLLPQSTWTFYKAQFAVVTKLYQRICGAGIVFTLVTQILHSKHFNYLGKNKLLPLIKHSESTVFIESLIVRVHSNSFRYPTSQCMKINILKCKHSKEIRIDNPSINVWCLYTNYKSALKEIKYTQVTI